MGLWSFITGEDDKANAKRRALLDAVDNPSGNKPVANNTSNQRDVERQIFVENVINDAKWDKRPKNETIYEKRYGEDGTQYKIAITFDAWGDVSNSYVEQREEDGTTKTFGRKP